MSGAVAANAASPCIGVCRMAADGYCAGCRRSLEEIACWAAMTNEERRRIRAALPGRAGSAEFKASTGVNAS